MEKLESDELFHLIGLNIKYYRKLYNLKKGKMILGLDRLSYRQIKMFPQNMF